MKNISYENYNNINSSDNLKNSTHHRRSLWKKSITFVLGLFLLIISMLSIIPLTSSQNTDNTVFSSAKASGFMCSNELGYNMDNKSSWDGMIIKPNTDASNRKWTLQEAFGDNGAFVNYAGEGKGQSFLISDKDDVKGEREITFADGSKSRIDAIIPKFDDLMEKNKSKFEELRTFSNCGGNHVLITIANTFISLSDGISSFSQFFAVTAFNPNFICPTDTSENCLNLAKIIGGTNRSNGGLIGSLTSSIYFPLLALAVLIATVSVARSAFKGQLVKALQNAIWIVASVFIGVILLVNPNLTARAPMTVNNVVAGCVISAFNGENCFNGTSTGTNNDSDNFNSSTAICTSGAATALDEKMAMNANSITCNIWKAFVLEPLAQGSFGLGFDELDTKKGNEAVTNAIKEAGFTGQDFCVYLKTDGSMDSYRHKTLNLTSGKEICNILAYQMYLQTNATSGNDKLINNDIDPRWYKIIFTVAENDSMWSNWSGNSTSVFNKIGLALLSIFVSGFGTFIIFIASISSLVYYIGAILLMAFAPIFLLIAIDADRGRSIMFGWLEKVISSIILYLFSAIFLIIVISIYGGILSNANSIALTFLIVLILSFALFMYRKELANMIGTVRLGGNQVSSSLTDKIKKNALGGAKSATKFAASTSGSAVGAKLGGESFSSGAKGGALRELSRQKSFVGNVARQYERASTDTKMDMKRDAENLNKKAKAYGSHAHDFNLNAKEARQNLSENSHKLGQIDSDIYESSNQIKAVNGIREDSLKEMNDDFYKNNKIIRNQSSNDIQELQKQKTNPNLSPEEIQAIDQQIRNIQLQKDRDLTANKEQYKGLTQFKNFENLKRELENLELKFKIAEVAGADDKVLNSIRAEMNQTEDELRIAESNININDLQRLNSMHESKVKTHLNNLGYSYDNYHEIYDKHFENIKFDNEYEEILNENMKLDYVESELSNEAHRRKEISEYRAERLQQSLNALNSGDTLSKQKQAKIEDEINKELIKKGLEDETQQDLRLGTNNFGNNQNLEDELKLSEYREDLMRSWTDIKISKNNYQNSGNNNYPDSGNNNKPDSGNNKPDSGNNKPDSGNNNKPYSSNNNKPDSSNNNQDKEKEDSLPEPSGNPYAHIKVPEDYRNQRYTNRTWTNYDESNNNDYQKPPILERNKKEDYNSAPETTSGNNPVVNSKPVVNSSNPTVDTKPVVNTNPVVDNKPIVDSKPVVDKPLIPNRVESNVVGDVSRKEKKVESEKAIDVDKTVNSKKVPLLDVDKKRFGSTNGRRIVPTPKRNVSKDEIRRERLKGNDIKNTLDENGGV